jgi:hypothetical protein
VLDIDLYLITLGQARKFIETCGTINPLGGRKFVYFYASFFTSARAVKEQQHLD